MIQNNQRNELSIPSFSGVQANCLYQKDCSLAKEPASAWEKYDLFQPDSSFISTSSYMIEIGHQNRNQGAGKMR